MRRLLLIAMVPVALSLSACGTTENANLKLLLSDLQTCHRAYTVAVGTGGAGLSGPSATATANINCDPVTPAPVAVPAAQ